MSTVADSSSRKVASVHDLTFEVLSDMLTPFLEEKTGGKVSITGIKKLSGGAIQENRLLTLSVAGGDFAGEHEWVLRSDADTVITESLSRKQEYQLLSHAHAAGIQVAKPLWYGDKSVFGYECFVMEKAEGITRPAHLTNPKRFNVDRDALTASLGKQLAMIHGLQDDPSIDFLVRPTGNPALFWLAQFSEYLNGLDESYPILELTIRVMTQNLPAEDDLVISHRDFRTGNLMIDENGLTAILDWEFCAWSDPHEDIAWFTAPCWRFASRDKEAGGMGDRETLYAAYEAQSNRKLDPKKVAYWEMFATLRWAIIAIEQGYRHLGDEPSLELALTAHIVPELEQDLLLMLKEFGLKGFVA